MLNKGDVVADYLNPSISDHSPILVTLSADSHGGGRPFKIFNYLVHHKDFLPLIED